MLDFFGSLIEYVELAWNMLVNLVTALVNLLRIIPVTLALPSYVSGLMPTFLASCMIAVVAVSAVKLVIGR